MKLAFTSCICTSVHPVQAVWDQMAVHQPDRLLLLGDSVYIDVPWIGFTHPKDLPPAGFLQHLLDRYRELLAQPRFRALVAGVPTDAIWDDHDFLWNESYKEGATRKVIYRDKVDMSRNLFNAYLAALAAGLAPNSFPTAINDTRINVANPPPPDYRYRQLGQGVHLHLTDGRSWRHKKNLLGLAQRDAIAARMQQAAANDVHLLASGSIAIGHKGDCWSEFPDDYAWLLDVASRHRVLVLSGDIHANRFEDATTTATGLRLYEATASGAAVGRLVVDSPVLENFGLLTIDDTAIDVAFFQQGAPDTKVQGRRIDRISWT
jgi:alkaline phosphatase D